MNVAIKIIAFFFMLNLATGIILAVVPDFNTSPEYRNNLNYNNSYMTTFNDDMSGVINPDSRIEDAGNAVYRVLDLLNIGFIADFLELIKNSLWGFVNVMESVFSQYMDENVGNVVFNSIRAILTFAYIFAAFSLWTGKEVNK